jgi:hypothetical protein
MTTLIIKSKDTGVTHILDGWRAKAEDSATLLAYDGVEKDGLFVREFTLHITLAEFIKRLKLDTVNGVLDLRGYSETKNAHGQGYEDSQHREAVNEIPQG